MNHDAPFLGNTKARVADIAMLMLPCMLAVKFPPVGCPSHLLVQSFRGRLVSPPKSPDSFSKRRQCADMRTVHRP